MLYVFLVSEPEPGGYDYEFVDRVPPKYICNICQKVIREARLTVCCGQHFCDSCLQQWQSTTAQKAQNTCPHCRQPDFQSVLNKEKMREINELRVRCVYRQGGCRWSGALEDLKQHLEQDSCGNVVVVCGKGCRERMERQFVLEHLEKLRIGRRYTCEHCGHTASYGAIVGIGCRFSHYDQCAQYPLDCPNDCGEKNIKRSSWSQKAISLELTRLG